MEGKKFSSEQMKCYSQPKVKYYILEVGLLQRNFKMQLKELWCNFSGK